MISKTIKAVVAASLLCSTVTLPVAGGDNTVATQCVQGGQNVNVTGQNCTIVAGSGAKGRARGDVVTLDLKKLSPVKLSDSGEIRVPSVGITALYQFNDIKIAIASFNLQNTSANPQVSPALKRIIDQAAAKNTWAKTMVWVGRQLPGETTFTEVTQTYSDLANLEKAAPITYQAKGNKELEIILPPSKKAASKAPQTFMIDFNPIK